MNHVYTLRVQLLLTKCMYQHLTKVFFPGRHLVVKTQLFPHRLQEISIEEVSVVIYNVHDIYGLFIQTKNLRRTMLGKFELAGKGHNFVGMCGTLYYNEIKSNSESNNTIFLQQLLKIFLLSNCRTIFLVHTCT